MMSELKKESQAQGSMGTKHTGRSCVGEAHGDLDAFVKENKGKPGFISFNWNGYRIISVKGTLTKNYT